MSLPFGSLWHIIHTLDMPALQPWSYDNFSQNIAHNAKCIPLRITVSSSLCPSVPQKFRTRSKSHSPTLRCQLKLLGDTWPDPGLRNSLFYGCFASLLFCFRLRCNKVTFSFLSAIWFMYLTFNWSGGLGEIVKCLLIDCMDSFWTNKLAFYEKATYSVSLLSLLIP